MRDLPGVLSLEPGDLPDVLSLEPPEGISLAHL